MACSAQPSVQEVRMGENDRPFATHTVANQPPPLVGRSLFDDRALREAVAREDAAWAQDRLAAFGTLLGQEETLALGHAAGRHPPILQAFDRFGQRLDRVEYHPAYHAMMRLGIAAGLHALPWTEPRPGAHVAHAALEYMLTQVEPGVCCPLTMTYAAVPALRRAPELATEWEPRILSLLYDGSDRPVAAKPGATVGMAMTEKQGGSDLRVTTTRADP